MLKLILARLVFMAAAGLLLLTFLFGLFHAIPGDPARLIAGDSAPEALVQSIRQAYGLDQPLMTQYTTYMGRVLHGDFGLSNFSRQPVLKIVMPRLLNTAKLAGWSMLLAMSLSLLLGSLSAMYWDRPLDRGITAFSLAGICTPIFVTGILGVSGVVDRPFAKKKASWLIAGRSSGQWRPAASLRASRVGGRRPSFRPTTGTVTTGEPHRRSAIGSTRVHFRNTPPKRCCRDPRS